MAQNNPATVAPREERLLFGRNLRAARLKRGMRQQDVAEHSGLTSTFVSRVERGVSGISLDSAALLAEAVAFPLHQLLDPTFSS